MAKTLHVLIMAAVLLAGAVSCSDGSQQRVAGIPRVFRGPPVTVGVCVSDRAGAAGDAVCQEKGVRAAHNAFKDLMGREVRLVFRYAASDADCGRTVRSLVDEDHASGVIVCAAPGSLGGSRDIMAGRGVPFVVTGPCMCGGQEGSAPCEMRLCMPWEVRARACAGFLAHSLKARRICLVMDGRDPGAVKYASLFASELASTRSRLVRVVFAGGGRDPWKALDGIDPSRVDAVSLLLSGESSLDALKRLKGRSIPVLVAGPVEEWALKGRAVKILDGVYVQSDFIEDAVSSQAGAEFLAFCRAHERAPVGPNTATGAEAYLLMVELLSKASRAGLEEALRSMSTRPGALLSFSGIGPYGPRYTSVLFGRIEKGFFGPALMRPAARVQMAASDPVADVGAQEFLRNHGEVGLVDALLD